MEEKHIVAIEIGSSKLRGALGVIDRNGTLNVVAVHDEPLVENVHYGQIRNVEEVGLRIDGICKKLQNHAYLQPRKISRVYVGVSGLTVGAVTRTVEKQFDEDTEITVHTIDELRDSASENPSPGREILEILPREYLVDNLAAVNPVGTVGKSIKATFNVIESQPSLKNNIDRVIVNRLGLDVNEYIVAPLAQAEAVLHPDEKNLGCVFVDFGAETTTVAVMKQGSLRYLATLPIGSRNITRDLISLNMPEHRAEQIKKANGNALSASLGAPRVNVQDNIDLNEVNNYVSARAGEIVANILAQVDYSKFKLSDLPGGFIIVGGGANLRGFSELLANKSHQKVRKGEILPSKVRVTDTSIQSANVIDVVSLLLYAAENNPIECIELTETVDDTRPNRPYNGPYTQQHPRQHPGSRYGDEQNDDDSLEGSRIGRYDSDEDIFVPKKEKNKKHKEPKERKEPKKPGILDKFRERIVEILTEDPDESDFYDEDE